MAGLDPKRVANAVALLRELQPEQLAYPELAELVSTGKALFKRPILQEEFGRQDVIEHLKSVQEHRALLRKLQKLQAQINPAHSKQREQARSCQINRQRHHRMAAIEAGAPVALGAPDGVGLPQLRAPADDGAEEPLVANGPAGEPPVPPDEGKEPGWCYAVADPPAAAAAAPGCVSAQAGPRSCARTLGARLEAAPATTDAGSGTSDPLRARC